MSDIIIYGRGKTGKSLQKMLEILKRPFCFYDDEHGFDKDISFAKGSLVVLSPGVSPYADGVITAKKAGAKVIGELEFCQSYLKGRVVSVTGTNGKTTTCEMIAHILSESRKKVYLLGNGGIPLSEKIFEIKNDDITVLESSSFQLADCKTFSPYISVFTNLACDHINYHGSFEAYKNAKLNNFIHQQKESYAIFNADDNTVVKLSEKCSCKKLFYSLKNSSANCYCDGKNILVTIEDKKTIVDALPVSQLAKHNLSNALAAILVSKILGIEESVSVNAIASYKILPHRMQFVDSFCGVTFVDDSKATNVHATVSALSNYDCPLALILGGSGKCESFDPIFKNIGGNVKYIVAAGETAEEIASCARAYNVEVKIFNDIKLATYHCYKMLKTNGGGTVLMSNACASFDRFGSYSERGDYFQKVVRELHSGEEKN